ncbi:MAG: superoxide dismutase [Ni] [bacterium]
MIGRERYALALIGSLILIALSSSISRSHCQIPCGIYDDKMRFSTLAEHITTIEKSMQQILELEKATPVNYNQIVRWVNNKDEHADAFAEIITYYFLAQRIKPLGTQDEQASHDYGNKLALLHQMVFYAMKAKQTTDLGYVLKLRSLLDEFNQAYFGEKAGESEHQH